MKEKNRHKLLALSIDVYFGSKNGKLVLTKLIPFYSITKDYYMVFLYTTFLKRKGKHIRTISSSLFLFYAKCKIQ